MRLAKDWKEYELLDATNGCRLERWGKTVLIRPDPQVVWQFAQKSPLWQKPNAIYHRSPTGGGEWEKRGKFADEWVIAYGDLRLKVSPTGFKHTGIFPEQGVNWDAYRRVIAAAKRPVRVLNLFGYTGGATLACAAAGAQVCHVDASKGMVAWARENAALSGLASKPIRWIVDDCGKFVQREARRGSVYDAIIMDPPSYGRGPGGEVWKLEDSIYALLADCAAILSDKPLFFAVNSYTTGLSPAVMQYMVRTMLCPKYAGSTASDEIGLPVASTGGALPAGATSVWLADGMEHFF